MREAQGGDTELKIHGRHLLSSGRNSCIAAVVYGMNNGDSGVDKTPSSPHAKN